MSGSGNIQQPLSERLKDLLSGCTFETNRVGHSGSAVYRVNGFKGGAAYLKISPSEWDTTLRSEMEALSWLSGKAPVPELLFYEQVNGMDYMLTSEVIGQDASREAHLSKPDQLVRLYAEGIKLLHSLPIEGCPLDQSLRHKLAEGERRVREGKVDEADLEEENEQRKPIDIYSQLLEKRPTHEDLVFTHGDYCLPNIIIDGNRIAGFIDLGRAGVADRYQDIALAIRSLRHNYGSDRYKSAFIEAYGIGELDEDKVDYYILLDELF
ncbi:APH(3') family aminoglycoside O-phosphotransferase [Cohnella yongneupensis]|uniref:APH(3') family aminoglycoside O-phosphotransferase n=1 Tax=Cohnella yongneupensis TaxID=425006 RepID=A0ABW0QVB2_9BACL